MPLIKCPDCLNDVSDKAPSCLRCGRQIAATTIEKTGKGIKSAKAIAVVCMMLSPVMTCGGISSQSFGVLTLGIFLFMVGGPLFIGSTVLRWWRHE